VKPLYWVARINKGDIIDFPYQATAFFTRVLHHVLSATVTGNVRFYAAAIAAGAIIILALMVRF